MNIYIYRYEWKKKPMNFPFQIFASVYGTEALYNVRSIQIRMWNRFLLNSVYKIQDTHNKTKDT